MVLFYIICHEPVAPRQQPPKDQDVHKQDDIFAAEISDLARAELENAWEVEKHEAVTSEELQAESEPVAQEPEPKRCRGSSVQPAEGGNGTGISGVFTTQRKGVVCMHCTTAIAKGDTRFEFVYLRNRPPRSIHPHCLSQMDRISCSNSIQNLESLLENSPPKDSDHLQACQSALASLQNMMNVYSSSSSSAA